MGKVDIIVDSIIAQAQPICDELGLDLIEVHVHPFNETLNIQVLADRPLGGIGMEECTKLNHRLDHILFDVMNLGNNYTLEVASPGLDRPLKTFKDFRRVVGRDVHFFLREKFDGKMEFEAEVLGVRADDILIMTKKGEVTLPIAQIEKGKQIII